MSQITVRMNLVKTPTTNLVAMCDAEVNGVGIRGIKVINGSNGPFAGMPSREKRQVPGEWEDVCFPASKELHQDLQKAVVTEYNRLIAAA